MPARLLVLVMFALMSLWIPTRPAHAQVDILGAAEAEVTSEVSEEKAAKDRRLAALHALQGRNDSRVLVLPWPDSTVTEKNVLFKTMVQNRIGRPNAKFYPGIDLYQDGRARREDLDGLPVLEGDQPGSISDDDLAEIRRRFESVKRQFGSSSNNMDLADAVLPLVKDVWFNDRAATRELLFDMYLTIGRAMSASKYQGPPYYQNVGEENCNYFLYLAAAMVWEEREAGGEPVLAPKLPKDQVGEIIDSLMTRISGGIHPTIPVAFHDQGVFDAEQFAGDYTVFINGIERVVDGKGFVDVPRGRIDIFLQRDDGYSLSDKVEVRRLDDKFYFVVGTARQKMGYELIESVRTHPGECVAGISREAVRLLATYQALHQGSEVYVAVPWAGSAYDAYVWRWDKDAAQLVLQEDRNGGFPVRFVALTGVGIGFNGVTVSSEDAEQLVSAQAESGPADVTPPDLTALAKGMTDLKMASVPVDFQLRGHFNRFMFGFGVQLASNVDEANGGEWRERYQVEKGNMVVARPDGSEDPLADPVDPSTIGSEVLHIEKWSRLVYGTLGVVALKDATFGIGPRAYARFGWYNLPHAFDLTGHIGLTEDPSFGKKDHKGRVVGLIDLDLFAGALLPFGQTLLNTEYKDPTDPSKGYKVGVRPTFGFTVGGGFSF